MSDLTVVDALKIVRQRAQWCRAEGESDMRSIIYLTDFLMDRVNKGRTKEEIMEEWEDE